MVKIYQYEGAIRTASSIIKAISEATGFVTSILPLQRFAYESREGAIIWSNKKFEVTLASINEQNLKELIELMNSDSNEDIYGKLWVVSTDDLTDTSFLRCKLVGIDEVEYQKNGKTKMTLSFESDTPLFISPEAVQISGAYTDITSDTPFCVEWGIEHTFTGTSGETITPLLFSVSGHSKSNKLKELEVKLKIEANTYVSLISNPLERTLLTYIGLQAIQQLNFDSNPNLSDSEQKNIFRVFPAGTYRFTWTNMTDGYVKLLKFKGLPI